MPPATCAAGVGRHDGLAVDDDLAAAVLEYAALDDVAVRQADGILDVARVAVARMRGCTASRRGAGAQ
jgi:hypothetical protein